jgi:L-alanine-DL-glutamate epimerase-like enolase superfamily enzyme
MSENAPGTAPGTGALSGTRVASGTRPGSAAGTGAPAERAAAGRAVLADAGMTPDLGRITALRSRLVTVPLPRPWGSDVLTHRYLEVIVETDAGARGAGFTWTPSIGALAVQALLETDIRDFVLGRVADPQALWPVLWARLHEAGSGGITTIAMAGLDLALWDAVGVAVGASVTELVAARLGTTQRASVEVYGSGVNRHYSLDELVAQAGRWRDAGYSLVKMKVGGRPLAADVERVAAVRDAIGDGVRLALDANQLWSLDEAFDAIGELKEFDLHWIEEPLRADDLDGASRLRRRIDVPLAMGENLHTVYRFREAMDAGACDLVQPNIVRVGGITPFLAISAEAGARDVPLHPHLLPDLSGQLALALAEETLVEDVEDASFDSLGLLAEPAPIVIDVAPRESGSARRAAPRLTSRGRPGLGIQLR